MGLTTKHKPKEDRDSGEIAETKQPCPLDGCGSSDAVTIYLRDDGTHDAHCFSCGGHISDPYSSNPTHVEKKVKSKVKSAIGEIKTVHAMRSRALPHRGITKETCEHFGVKALSSEKDRATITHQYYPRTGNGKVLGYKVKRVEDKSFYAIGKVKSSDMFGYTQAMDSGSKTLYITEGEDDTLALYQVLKDFLPEKWAHLHPAVVSLKDGAGSAVKSIETSHDLLATFKEVVLVLDMDKPGQAATDQLCKLLTLPTKVAKFSEKDANDMLLAGKEKQLHKACVFDARVKRPDGIKTVRDLYDEALTPVVWGRPWPWPTMTKFTYGKRRGELIIVGAGAGCGKTEMLKEMIQSDTDEGLPVGVIFLEEPGAKTLKVLAGKRVNKRFHIPGDDWTDEDLKGALDEMLEEDLINIYDSNGAKDWEEIRAKIRWWVVGCGIKDIYLDHLTALTAGEFDERKALDLMLAEMAGIAEELDFTFVVVSHLTRPDKSRKSHEEGGRVRMADFRGSGAIGFWAHYMFGAERDTQSEDHDERNTVILRCIKDRYTGNATGRTVELTFDHDTGRLLEPDCHSSGGSRTKDKDEDEEF